MQILDKVCDMPVVVQRQVPTVLTVHKPVEIPLLQFTVKVVDIPFVEQRQFPRGRTSENLDTCTSLEGDTG